MTRTSNATWCSCRKRQRWQIRARNSLISIARQPNQNQISFSRVSSRFSKIFERFTEDGARFDVFVKVYRNTGSLEGFLTGSWFFFYRVRRVLFMAGLFKKAKRQPKETSNKRTENGQEGCQRHLLTTSSDNLQNGFQWVTFASFACFFYRVRRILFMAGIF